MFDNGSKEGRWALPISVIQEHWLLTYDMNNQITALGFNIMQSINKEVNFLDVRFKKWLINDDYDQYILTILPIIHSYSDN